MSACFQKCHCNAGFVGTSTTNGPATCVEQSCADFDGAGTAASCGSDATCSDNSVGDGYKCSCNNEFTGIAMLNSPATCVAVPTSGCIDLQYTSNDKCTASAPITNGAQQPNCDSAQDQNQCKAETLSTKNSGETGACNWIPGGVTGPWHSRNGISNTCAVMVQHNYCTSDYFNTFGGVQVTSADACCGCGGGATPAKCNTITGSSDITAFCADNGANGLLDTASSTNCVAASCVKADDAVNCCKPGSEIILEEQEQLESNSASPSPSSSDEKQK